MSNAVRAIHQETSQMISGAARLAGVLGWPVSHSRSPRLHNAWLRRYGIDGAYLPLPVAPEHLRDALRGLLACHFVGANVTIPHKEAVLSCCDALDQSARRAGAVNTLVFSDGRILGGNTDGAGFLANLRAHDVTIGGPVLLLGAGGAARAIAAALLDAGSEVTVANRTAERAQALANALPGLRVLPWTQREAALADQAMLVNTTSLGMQGHENLALDLAAAGPSLVVADIVYVPRRTRLLHNAEACGLRTVEGIGMLLHQAVPGFAAWFGVTPEVDDAMLRLVTEEAVLF
jgi:shikimate dehydrogenase